MADKNPKTSNIKRAWDDSWNWLLGARIGAVVFTLVGGAAGGVFGLILAGLLGGVIGAAVGIVITVGLVFFIHMIITPARLEREATHNYIVENANYYPRIYGSKKKRRYLRILELLEAMIQIENEITDSKAGKILALDGEILHITKLFRKQIKLPEWSNSKALEVFLYGKADKKVNQTIKQLKLNIVGNMPTDKQTRFFLDTRKIMDGTRFGIANKLPSEYLEYSRELDELVESEGDLQDWMVLLLIFPAGFNSGYLWYCAQGKQRQGFFIQFVKFDDIAKSLMNDFKSQREIIIKVLIKYAKKSIKKVW